MTVEQVTATKDLMTILGIDDTIDNRRKLICFLFNMGVNNLSMNIGIMNAMKSEFPKSRIQAILDEMEKQELTPVEPYHAPQRCDNCGMRVLFNGVRWACNCRTWESSPKPDPVCQNCHQPVVSNHYYYQCGCNRYDCPPESEEWANVFPTE